MYRLQTELEGSFLLPDKRDYAGASQYSSRSFSQQPYSSSLENLDPSAKEFLVDAGVVLDKSSMLSTVSSSLPNLSKFNSFLTAPADSRYQFCNKYSACGICLLTAIGEMCGLILCITAFFGPISKFGHELTLYIKYWICLLSCFPRSVLISLKVSML